MLDISSSDRNTDIQEYNKDRLLFHRISVRIYTNHLKTAYIFTKTRKGIKERKRNQRETEKRKENLVNEEPVSHPKKG